MLAGIESSLLNGIGPKIVPNIVCLLYGKGSDADSTLLGETNSVVFIKYFKDYEITKLLIWSIVCKK